MNCFDCHGLTRTVPAIAVCVDCGAGVCAEHAHPSPRWITITMAINRSVAVNPPARTLRCRVCQAARDAVPATAHVASG